MSLFLVISIIWVTFEIILSRRKRQSGENKKQDGSSLHVLWITLILSILLGIYLSQFSIGKISSHLSIIHYLGLILIIVGLIIRWFAILELKEFFTVTVAIQKDHRVVNSGLYKYIRHPAYLGSLLSFLGLGFALQNWISILVIFIPIFGALSYRIHVEENVLNTEFVEEYSKYSSRTKKLIPWVY